MNDRGAQRAPGPRAALGFRAVSDDVETEVPGQLPILHRTEPSDMGIEEADADLESFLEEPRCASARSSRSSTSGRSPSPGSRASVSSPASPECYAFWWARKSRRDFRTSPTGSTGGPSPARARGVERPAGVPRDRTVPAERGEGTARDESAIASESPTVVLRKLKLYASKTTPIHFDKRSNKLHNSKLWARSPIDRKIAISRTPDERDEGTGRAGHQDAVVAAYRASCGVVTVRRPATYHVVAPYL